ncbi:MAG: hypothetical protein F6K09_15770 [Merismopedia sp. SIO2A8]|nr:hypothetical protein [Symploca sp. SIO2B6]NET50139.1 hypothetical protein [Merismopedia sp. SIO2A8]
MWVRARPAAPAIAIIIGGCLYFVADHPSMVQEALNHTWVIAITSLNTVSEFLDQQ